MKRHFQRLYITTFTKLQSQQNTFFANKKHVVQEKSKRYPATTETDSSFDGLILHHQA